MTAISAPNPSSCVAPPVAQSPRKVLILSPHFPPKNAADMHRVRTSLPYYRKFDWNATVLALTPDTSDGVDDPLLEKLLPPDVECVRVSAWREVTCRKFGFGLVDYRAFVPLYRVGTRLLSRTRYDVVFFSTTLFLTFVFSAIWKRRFGCKIVFDIHDPWYLGKHSPYTRETAPGGWRKYRILQALAKVFEPIALRHADHIICVSQGYVDMLTTRYPWLSASRFTVLPFGAAKEDYVLTRTLGIRHEIASSPDRPIRWVAATAVAVEMRPILAAFFRQLAVFKQRHPKFASRLRVHFIGTHYAPSPSSKKLVESMAAEYGVGDIVHEQLQRIPYLQVMALNADCDAILLFGGVSPNYTASKLFGCVLAGKPILAMFHRDSLVAGVARCFPNVMLAEFVNPSDLDFEKALAEGITWLTHPSFDRAAIENAIAPWTAEALTRRQCAIFDQVCGATTSQVDEANLP